ncbi:CBS domain-containing protein [soil metagenome]
MQVAQILKVKGDMVFTVRPEESVGAAAALLHSRRVGALVVMGEGGDVAGILSERDVVSIAATEGVRALERPVSICMTQKVEFADPGDSVDALLARMTDRRIRHLPVCEGGRMVGIVSIGDLVKWKIAETLAEAEGLKAYIAAG